MLSLIVAMDRNRVIGMNNEMPWHLPRDLQHFKETTLGAPIIMGRKTFESIGRVLPGRRNIVLTRKENNFPEEVEIISTVDEIIAMKKTMNEEFFVIGGGHLFEQIMPYADRLYITLIDTEFEGDVFFPAIDETVWKEVDREKGIKDDRNVYDYYFIQYNRKN